MDDVEAYNRYPLLRRWYNKLWLSEELGYNCGPSGIAPKISGWYIVRPIMNLHGMGLGAKKVWIDADDRSKVPLGYFWCEWFDGRQYSVTYEWNGYWKPISCWEGVKSETDLYRFSKWTRKDFYPEIGSFYDEIADCNVDKINVEFIEKNPIEVHLRTSPDPDYDELIPVWQNDNYLVDNLKEKGYSYITSYDDAGGFLENPRLGFLVKNN